MHHYAIRLTVIPEPPPNSRNVKTICPPEVTFFADDNDTDLICGKCKAVLADGIKDGTLSNMVLKCNNCLSFNEIPPKARSFHRA